MKVLIVSDSHGHIANLKAAIGIGIKAKAEAIIHCGDWDNKETVEAALSFNLPLYSILGNADVDSDLETYLQLNCKKFDPDFLKIDIGGRKIGITHRVKANDERFDKLSVVFSGHYHSKEEKMINFLKFVRPGALINGINFAIYETETNEVEFISETE